MMIDREEPSAGPSVPRIVAAMEDAAHCNQIAHTDRDTETTRKTGMRFNVNMDKMITKCVHFYNENRAPHGKTKELYENDLCMFVQECSINQSRNELSWKTI